MPLFPRDLARAFVVGFVLGAIGIAALLGLDGSHTLLPVAVAASAR